MNEKHAREQLAAQVRSDRRRLYGTVDRARSAARISRGTWEKAEKGERIKDFSWAAIETALKWPEGRAGRVLSGDEQRSPPSTTTDPLADLRAEVDLLRAEQSALKAEVEDLRNRQA